MHAAGEENESGTASAKGKTYSCLFNKHNSVVIAYTVLFEYAPEEGDDADSCVDSGRQRVDAVGSGAGWD